MDLFPASFRQQYLRLYWSAARLRMVFSWHMLREMPRYKQIDNLDTFLLHCLYIDGVTSRTQKDSSGYYLAPVSHQRIPLFRKIPVPNEPWSDEDDEEIGRIALFLIERKPFEQTGGLLHGVGTYLGYFMDANVSPKAIISHCRLMNRHLWQFGVNDCLQSVSQGCWSQFCESNTDAHTLTISYEGFADSEIKTWYEGQVYSPLLILNRRSIMMTLENERPKTWKLICAVILTALRLEPDQKVCYGLWLRRDIFSDGLLVNVGPQAETPNNLQEVFSILCQESNVEVIKMEDAHECDRHTRATCTPTVTHRDSTIRQVAVGGPFYRIVPDSRLATTHAMPAMDDRLEVEVPVDSTDYEILLPALEVAFMLRHTAQNGFALRPHESGFEEVTSLMYLALDDIEIPPLFLRKSQEWLPDERAKMVEDAQAVVERRWEFITSGDGEESVDRNDVFVETSREFHEFL